MINQSNNYFIDKKRTTILKLNAASFLLCSVHVIMSILQINCSFENLCEWNERKWSINDLSNFLLWYQYHWFTRHLLKCAEKNSLLTAQTSQITKMCARRNFYRITKSIQLLPHHQTFLVGEFRISDYDSMKHSAQRIYSPQSLFFCI